MSEANMFDQVAKAMADMQADHDRVMAEVVADRDRLLRDRDHLRAAAQAAITICAEYTDRPPLPDNCDADEEGGTTYCHDDARRAVAERVRDALDLTKQGWRQETAVRDQVGG